MGLFERKDFVGHSGDRLDFKIECDNLTEEDLETIAYIVSKKFDFKMVFGVPTGGLIFEEKLKKYTRDDSNNILIIDDVLTTGLSMRDMRSKVFSKYCQYNMIGVVLFSRNKHDKWIHPIFQMW